MGEYSLHGPDHWRRVEGNGLMLARETGADVFVVRLFAVLHDCRRQSEGSDPRHGERAAETAAAWRGVHFALDDARFALLTMALIEHDRGLTSDDPTIGTCWDADRLDLVRCGVRPDPRLMSTVAGKAAARGGRSGVG